MNTIKKILGIRFEKDKPAKLFGKTLPLTFYELLSALIALVLGLILLLWPNGAANFVMNGIGTICILFGIFRIAHYFLIDSIGALGSNDLASGLIWISIGILIMILKKTLISLVPMVFALVLLFSSFKKIQTALQLKYMQARMWYITLGAGILLLVFGILIACNPFTTILVCMRILGIFLIFEAIVDTGSEISFKKIYTTFVSSKKSETSEDTDNP